MKTIATSVLCGIATCVLVGSAVAQPQSYGLPSLLPTSHTAPSWNDRSYVYPTTAVGPAHLADQVNPPAPVPVPQLDQSLEPESPADLYANDQCGCCADPVCGGLCCGPTWYAAANGLIFGRNKPKFSQLSYDDTNLVGQVISTDTGLGHWDGGPEFRLGYYLSPCWAIEAGYWGIYGSNEGTTVYGANLPGFLNSALDFSPLNIGADNVNDLFDAAAAHRLRRDYNINNFELNFIRGQSPWGQPCGFRLSYLAGIRYFRFSEDFNYASADAIPVFGADLNTEAYYDIDISNDLWGFQLGGRADWYLTQCFSMYAGTKFGIYNNQIKHHSQIHNTNGTATVGPGNPLAGDEYDIVSEKSITSFVGELDLGLNLQMTPHWNAVIGYRAVAVSGIGYATDQIPTHLADLPGVASVESNANMILHGAYAGVGFVW